MMEILILLILMSLYKGPYIRSFVFLRIQALLSLMSNVDLGDNINYVKDYLINAVIYHSGVFLLSK